MDELIRKLEERRAKIAEQRNGHLKTAETNIECATEEQRSAYKAAIDAATPLGVELKEIDDRLKDLREQRDRDARAAEARKGDPGPVGDPASDPGRAHVTSEPTVYGRGSGHSYFLDMARAELRRGDGDGGTNAAAERMKRHAAEVDKQMPERRAAVERRAAKAYEEAFAVSPAERRALSRMERQGISPFERERRFISRTDGQGGYFVPPLWLIDEYIPYLRAGRVFADQWRSFPLPSGTDSINIPRVTLGTATGPQTSDGAPVSGRDMTDNFVNALVRTVAGQQDAAIQLLDQSPIAFDEIVFGDLMADLAMQLSGQLMLGSGTNGQLTGLFPAGVIGGSGQNGAFQSYGYVVNNAATAWTAASSTANFYLSVGQLISTLSRTRFRPPTGIITNPAVWYGMATAMDSQNRPLVVPSQNGTAFNAAAADGDSPVAEGPVGHLLGLPWCIDPNIPLTFGGTTAPYIGTISNGSTAPVPGAGGNPDYTPVIAAIWDDLYLWEGELRTRVLSEVLSGSLQVRFQCYAYYADMPNRYQDASGHPISYGNYNTTGTTGGVLSTAGLLSGF